MVNVYVCDWILCRNCAGGEEQIKLMGDPDWNYVLCEEIGSYIKIEVANLEQGQTVGFCEIEMFGQNGEK